MPVSLLMWFLVYHHRVAPLRVLGSALILPCPTTDPHEETDDPGFADQRNFYKVAKWEQGWAAHRGIVVRCKRSPTNGCLSGGAMSDCPGP